MQRQATARLRSGCLLGALGAPCLRSVVRHMNSPNIAVYKHATKGDYVFLRHAPLGPEGGASTAFGEFVHVSADDMRNKGLDLILADFEEYSNRNPKHGSVV